MKADTFMHLTSHRRGSLQIHYSNTRKKKTLNFVSEMVVQVSGFALRVILEFHGKSL